MSDLAVLGGSVDVVVRGGRIVDEAAPAGVPVLDASGCVVAPGFLDLQCNGGFGIDLLAEPERLWELAALLPKTGVTAWCPTIVTSPASTTERALTALRAGGPAGAAVPLGLHLEGPFLNPVRRGAHAVEHLSEIDAERAAGWSADAGVAIVTLAPELHGANALVWSLVSRGVVVSAGHSDATFEQAHAAVDTGVRLVTHLFNAMAPMHHRAPGLAGVALTDARVHVGVIADGLHLHPAAVAVAWDALRERLVLVTDAVAALGLPPGRSVLGDAVVDVGPEGVRLADGTLAGSNLAMDEAVRNLAAFTGCSLAEAVGAATAAPARALGLSDRGALEPGTRGDLVVLTPEGHVVATVIGGEVAWRS